MKYYLIIADAGYYENKWHIVKVPKIGRKIFRESLTDYPNTCLEISRKQFNFLHKQMVPFIGNK